MWEAEEAVRSNGTDPLYLHAKCAGPALTSSALSLGFPDRSDPIDWFLEASRARLILDRPSESLDGRVWMKRQSMRLLNTIIDESLKTSTRSNHKQSPFPFGLILLFFWKITIKFLKISPAWQVIIKILKIFITAVYFKKTLGCHICNPRQDWTDY